MKKSLRASAEMLMLMQDCGVLTDSITLNAAIQIAHHDNQFQLAHKEMGKYFDWAANAMREKYPECPCHVCKRSRK